jgi:hypothetical protein
MTCIHCQPSLKPITENPFKCTKSLSDEYHEGVELGACIKCGQPCLSYWVDLYDDAWRFWCAIDEAEKQRLLLPNTDEDELHDRAREIIRQHTVLQRHPVNGLEWIRGDACLLEGPPW